MRPRLDGLTLLMFIGAILCIARIIAGCSAGHVAAESAYGADLLRCVDKATTLAESKACRRAVDVRWGVDGGSR